MKTYLITYYDLHGDLQHSWTIAENEEEVKEQIKEDYWDIQKLVSIDDESN